jgi:hypothetical protein
MQEMILLSLKYNMPPFLGRKHKIKEVSAPTNRIPSASARGYGKATVCWRHWAFLRKAIHSRLSIYIKHVSAPNDASQRLLVAFMAGLCCIVGY